MVFKVKIDNNYKNNKEKQQKLKILYKWCNENCTIENKDDSYEPWGLLWWSENNNSEFYFQQEDHALMFKIKFL